MKIKGETKCKCGCGDDVGNKIITIVTNLSISLNCVAIVTSGRRCWNHHTKIYQNLGKPVTTNSYHLLGEAMDIKCIRNGVFLSSKEIMDEAIRMFGNQIWVYAINDTTVHIDCRNYRL